MTLELWINRAEWFSPSSGTQTIIAADIFGVDVWDSESRVGGRMGMLGSDVKVQSKMGAITPDEWVHVALVYDPKVPATQLYFNGELVDVSVDAAEIPKQHPNFFKIGTWYEANQAYRGYVDEVKLYDYPRSARQIARDARK